MASKLFQNNILDVGMLRGLSATRARLNISAATISVGAALACLGAMHYISTASSSVSLNMFIITSCMALLLIAGYIQAIWIGDRIWPAAWRHQIVQGHEPSLDQPPERPRHLEFLILCSLLVFLNGFALDRSQGGFLERYHHEGFFEVRLRAADPKERAAALKAMSDPLQVKLWTRPGIRALVRRSLREEQDPEVLSWAAWNAGSMKIEETRPELLALVTDPARPEAARVEAAQALGRLGADPQSEQALSTLLDDPSHTLQLTALRAMALMQQIGPHAQRLQTMSQGDDPELVEYALWALREAKPEGLRAWLREQLATPELTPGVRRCALLDALKMTSTAEDVDWARLQYVREEPEERCEAVQWDERDERRHTILFGDTTRVKLLKIVANAGGVVKHPEWFRRIAQDDNEPQHARELAATVLQQADRYKEK